MGKATKNKKSKIGGDQVVSSGPLTEQMLKEGIVKPIANRQKNKGKNEEEEMVKLSKLLLLSPIPHVHLCQL